MECQWKAEGMIEIENHCWRTTIEVVDQKEVIGGDLGGGNRVLMWSPHNILLSYEEKMETWG